jgi:hypothetical protein
VDVLPGGREGESDTETETETNRQIERDGEQEVAQVAVRSDR